MSQPRSRIAWQLAIALSAILVLLISVSTLIALKSLSSASLTTREAHLASEARLLADQLSTFHTSLKLNTSRLAGLFERRFASGVSLDEDQRLALGSRTAPALYLAGSLLNGRYELVDEFHNLTEGVATVFVRDGAEFVRISTSLLKEDGGRAVATALDHAHPAYESLLQGQQYVGRAELFGRLYMTQYVPVRDSAGQVVAVLFVGFDYTDDQAAQLERLKLFRIGQGGSLALIDERGQWLLAPYGVNADPELARRLQGELAQVGVGQAWAYHGGEFYSVSAPFAEGPWQVVASLPQDEIAEVTWSVGTQIALGSLISMLIAVAAVTALLRRRLRPLGNLVEQARAFGAGDLTVRTQAQSQDEIGELGRSFNQMGDALSSMVEQIREAASQVHTRSQQLSTLAMGAQSSMEQQSGEISSMAGAVEEFSATAQDIADSMRTTENLSSDNVQQTEQGSRAMDEASAALRQISQALDGTASTINLLGQRSQEIGGIVGVITAIAEQTNLLALNAAIEAARAGEQGRGFAVVADEVRNLASRTREATDEISSMIGSIQEQTHSAMATMRQGQTLMGEGIERNAKVADALAQILQQTNQAGEQFAAITTATHEQSSTATMLSGNLQAIAQVNDQQSHTVANLAQTAYELDKLASVLKREVSRFH